MFKIQFRFKRFLKKYGKDKGERNMKHSKNIFTLVANTHYENTVIKAKEIMLQFL